MTILNRKLVSTKGDAMDIEFILGQNITSWELRAEIWDTASSENNIQKANIEVSGGGTDQIEVTNATSGIFVVHIDPGETTDFSGDTNIEIEVTDTNSDVWTIFRDIIVLEEEKITWINPS